MSVREDGRAELARGGALSLAGSAFSALMGFLLTVVVSRMLGSSGAGVVLQATGVFAMVMAVAKLGLDSTAIYLLPRLRIDAPRRIRPSLLFMALLAVVAGSVLGLAVAVGAPLLWSGTDAEVARAVRAIAVFIPAAALTLVATSALRALGGVREYVLVNNVALPGLRPPLAAVAAVATGSAVVVALSWALPWVLALLVCVLLLVRRVSAVVPGGGDRGFAQADERRRIISFAIPRTLSAGLEQALTWIDVVIVGWIAGAGAAGIYGGASRFVQAGLLVDAALRVVVSPRFSQYLHTGQERRLRDLHTTATVWLVFFATPLLVLLGCFAPVVLRLLGPEFVTGGPVLAILCAGATITFLAGNVHSLLLMGGRSGWAAVNKAVVLTLNVVGNILLVPRHGIIAAAVVWAACMVVDAALALVQVRVILGVRPRLGAALAALAIVVVAVGSPCAISLWFLGRTPTGLLAATVAAVLVLLVAMRLFRRALRLDGLAEVVRRRR
ncbi:MAG: oligosaccharide flippase family protein [Pauljensenia sp.]